MQKQENFLFEGHRSIFCIKVPLGVGQPPPTHQMQSICVWEGSQVPNLQTEFNYLDLFKSYCIFCDFIVPTWSPWSQHCPSHPHVIPVIPMLSPCHPHIVTTLSPLPLEGPHAVLTPPMAVVSVVSSPHGPYTPMVPMLSPLSPHHPHIIPVIPMSSPYCLEGPYIIPTKR